MGKKEREDRLVIVKGENWVNWDVVCRCFADEEDRVFFFLV